MEPHAIDPSRLTACGIVADDLKACFGNTPSPEHGLYRRHVYLQQANGRRIVHDRHANVIVPRELTGYWDAHGPL
jgi:hypothetical protein